MKQKKSIKLLAMFMALTMICSLFLFGCTSEEETKTTAGAGGEEVTQSQEDPKYVYDAQVKDLQEHTFYFYVKDTPSAKHLDCREVYAEALTGDKINDAVFTRNSRLQEVYNCKIEEHRTTSPLGDSKEPLIAGEYICDVLFMPIKDSKTLAQSNLLVDFTTVENLNLEKGWWDAAAQKGISMAGKVFCIMGDATNIDERRSEAMFFNVEIVQDWDPTVNLYQEVRDGKWTIQRMYEIVQATAKDLDGDDVLTFDSKTDRYGLMAGTANNWCFTAGCGATLSKVDAEGNITIPLSPNDELMDVWSELRNLLTTNVRKVAADGDAFRSGRATFYCCNLGSATLWGNSTCKLGVIPYPKRNEQQKDYYITLSFLASGLCVPTTVANDATKDWEKAGFSNAQEFVAYFLDAYAYYSYQYLTPAFYDAVLNRQVMKDADSVEMLEISLRNKVYDPVVGYNMGGMENLFKTTGTPSTGVMGSDVNYDTFVSKYASNVDAARKAVTDYLTFVTT